MSAYIRPRLSPRICLNEPRCALAQPSTPANPWYAASRSQAGFRAVFAWFLNFDLPAHLILASAYPPR